MSVLKQNSIIFANFLKGERKKIESWRRERALSVEEITKNYIPFANLVSQTTQLFHRTLVGSNLIATSLLLIVNFHQILHNQKHRQIHEILITRRNLEFHFEILTIFEWVSRFRNRSFLFSWNKAEVFPIW